ncbi:MAG: NAD+ synthase [Rhodospirillales bacterium]|jgi:NAD+ synthase|nr:NAD+ synthase [Rhodospirillales bacterium]MDP6772735.1 NAD+ synthase [Rhodospirillales bacterium]
MSESLAIALAQINPVVGDIDGNAELVRAARREAADGGADLVVFGELAMSGYPPEDLVLKPAFQERVEACLAGLAAETADGGPALLVGAPWRQDARLHNAALLLDGGEIAAVRLKHELPNYGVFDEKRVFTSGPLPGPVSFRGARLGVMMCEDMWIPDVAECLKESGAGILVVLNGSPFESDKLDERLNHAVARVRESGLPLIYVNLVGGQDEVVFDGASFVLGADCALLAEAASWRPRVLLTRWRSASGENWICEPATIEPRPEGQEAVYRAMVTGLRDYVDKNRFPGVVLGLSGGIDSALTAAVAVDALGAARVRCVMMPSPHTSDESLEDAAAIAKLLQTTLDTIPIEPAMEAFGTMLAGVFTGHEADVTEENIQARARGLVLMAISNKLGHMVLTTGNKSEMAVGYATLYGDMSGGYSVLKDVYKTAVFALARWRNQARPEDFLGPAGRVIPERVVTKPPSAELRPDQTDQDTLPPYEDLDAILGALIEGERSVADLEADGFDAQVVRKVWHMVDRAEYKRRQAPPGVKITRRAFGRDRRYPITNRFPDLV